MSSKYPVTLTKSPKKYGCVTVYGEKQVFARKYKNLKLEKGFIGKKQYDLKQKRDFHNYVVDSTLRTVTSKTRQEYQRNSKHTLRIYNKFPRARLIIKEIFMSHKSSQLNFMGVPFPIVFGGEEKPDALADWKKRKSITINAAKKTPTFEDSSFASGWTEVGTNITAGTGVIDWAAPSGLIKADDRIYNDRTAIDDNEAVLRWDMTIDNYVANSGSGSQELVVCLTNEDTEFTNTQRWMGMRFQMTSSSNSINLFAGQGTLTGGSEVELGTNEIPNLTAGVKFYYELKRKDKLHYSLTVFTDSGFTEVFLHADFTMTVEFDATMRYIKVASYSNNAATNGTLDGTIDNVALFDGTNTVDNIPDPQTPLEEETGSFTSWTESGGNDVTKGTGQVDFSINNAVTRDDAVWKDLVSISNNNWVLDYDLDITDFTANSTNNAKFLYVGMSNLDGTNALDAIQDSIVLGFQTRSAGGEQFKLYWGNNENVTNNQAVFNLVPTDGKYYLRLIRLSETSATGIIYSDEARTQEIERVTVNNIDVGGVTDTRYIKIQGLINATSNGNMDGNIKNVIFYNNISEVNPATLDDYPVAVKILGDVDLQRKTAETFEDLGDWVDQTEADLEWVSSDNTQTRANIETDLIDYDNNADGTNVSISHDLGSALDNTKFVCHIALNNTLNVSNPDTFVVLSSLSSASSTDIAQDAIGFRISGTAQDTIGSVDYDNSAINGTVDQSFTNAWPVGQTRYFVITRTSSTTYNVKVFSDSAHTIQIGTTLESTCASTLTGLQFVKITNRVVSNATQAIYEIIPVRVWDGITNPVDQEVATFEDDFVYPNQPAADLAWPTSDVLKARVNIVNEDLDYSFTANNSGNNEAIVHDLEDELGVGKVLDSKFCVRFSNEITAHTNSSIIYAGLTDQDETTGSSDNHTFIGFELLADSTDRWFAVQENNQPITNRDVTNNRTWVNGEVLYWEIIRDETKYTINLYTDSSYSILDSTATATLEADYNILRYIKFLNRDNTSATQTITGVIDNVQVWNGITSPDATARKFVFTNDDFTNSAIEYSSENVSYDPINGDLITYCRVPSLASEIDTVLQMYYDYLPASNPDYDTGVWTEEIYNKTFDSNAFNVSGAAADGTALAVEIPSGSSLIGERVREVSMNLQKNNSPTGLFYVKIENSSETTLAETSMDISLLTVSPTVYNFVLNKDIILAEGDRIIVEYTDGTASDTLSVRGENTVEPATVNTQVKDPTWADVSFTLAWVFDSNPKSKEQSTWGSDFKAVQHLTGNAIDSTVFGNNGTLTNIEFEEQNNTVGIIGNGTSSKNVISDDSSITDIFDGGGQIDIIINPKSDGEGNIGCIWRKSQGANGWTFAVREESSGFVKINFVQVFSGNNAEFRMVNATVPLNEITFLTLKYNDDSVSNNAELIVNGIKHTVENGLLIEQVTPTGTRSSDSGQVSTMGAEDGGTQTFDGFEDEGRLLDQIKSTSEAISNYNAEKADSDFITVGPEVAVA